MGGDCSQQQFWEEWMEVRRTIESDREEELFGPEDEMDMELPVAAAAQEEAGATDAVSGTVDLDLAATKAESGAECGEPATNG
jgi:hypothetical protein